MRIAHIVYSLEMGGAEVLVAQLCRVQRASGHEVFLCAYSTLGAVGEVLRAEGFEIFIAGEAHPARTVLHYIRLFRQLKLDVVHCHNPAPTLQAALSARLAGTRRVLATRHSLVAPPYETVSEIKFNLAAFFCDWVVGVCETTCENLRGTPLAQTKKIVRVYNGTSPLVRTEPLRRDEGVFLLVFVGRLAAIKSLETLIHAVALAMNEVSSLQLWIVGNGPARLSLESLVQQLGVADHVHFWGQQLKTDAYFSSADCFAMSSKSEGLPMSLLQAMSLGLPAIATDVGGMGEVLRLCGSGLLSPVGDHVAMAETIIQLASDEILRKRLGQEAMNAYQERFTLEKMNQAYLELYTNA